MELCGVISRETVKLGQNIGGILNKRKLNFT
jgi:hypothetical protein